MSTFTVFMATFTYFIIATPSGSIGEIVGGTVGGLVAALTAVAVIGFILYRKRRYSGERFDVINYYLALSFLQPFLCTVIQFTVILWTLK